MIWEKVGMIVMEDRHNDMVTTMLEAGRKEFLIYGYERASLGGITREVSVTTGAIYGYSLGRKALFDALTSDATEGLLNLHRKEHRDFTTLSPEQQPARLNEITGQYIPWMVNYIYDHFGVFKLLLCCDAQEARDRCFDRPATVEKQSYRDFIKAMESLGYSAEGMNNTLIHTLCRSFFRQLHGFVSHDLSKEQVITCAVTLSRFQHAGQAQIMELGE